MTHSLLTRFFTRLLLPWISSFNFRSTALVQSQSFFSFSRLFLFITLPPSPSNIFLVLFLLSRYFSEVRIYVSAFLQLAHEARHVTLFRYIFTISFFLSFRFLRFFDSSSMRRIRAYLIRGLLCFSVHRKWSSS